MNVFNEVGTLRAAMESAAPYVDFFVIVDGAYAKFPNTGNNGASNDGTLELVKQLQVEWDKQIILVEAKGPWENEMIKRTAYWDALSDGDWALILDADERLAFGGNSLQVIESVNEIRAFNAGVCIFKFNNQKGEYHFATVTRIYRKLPGTHYAQTHAHLVHSEGCRWSQLQLPVVIEHYDYLRPEDRNKQRLDFYASGEMK
jgi:glycosyltransferase involved in cell wall biosynthesis